MKKLFFSAICAMAFSNGFASNVVLMNESETPCFDQYLKDKAALKSVGLSDNTAEAIANMDFEECLDRTYGPEE